MLSMTQSQPFAILRGRGRSLRDVLRTDRRKRRSGYGRIGSRGRGFQLAPEAYLAQNLDWRSAGIG